MAKGKSPAFQFFPDAWLSSSSVSLMTPAEEGAYIRLLCHEWLAPDCGLPDDDKALSELSRLRKGWKHSGPKLRQKFSAIGGRLFNDRLVEERDKQRVWREKSSIGGKQSATKRQPTPQPKSNHPSNLVGGVVEVCYQPNSNSSSSSSSSSSKELEPLAPIPVDSDWALSTAFVTEEYPATDYGLMLRIIQASVQAAAGEGQELTDVILLQALQEARKSTPKQHNAVLYEKTVPTIIRNWSRAARRASA